MKEFSNAVGIPLQCIMAVRNYSDGKSKPEPKMDTLILDVVKHMIDFGNDFIDKVSENLESQKPLRKEFS